MNPNIEIRVKIRLNMHSTPVGAMIRLKKSEAISEDWRKATLIERELWFNGITTIPSTKNR